MRNIAELIPSEAPVVVMAPHPDDLEEVGVTMRRLLEKGCRISLHVLTSGTSGVENRFCPDDTSSENKRRIRRNEQREAMRFFGLPSENLHFAETEEDSDSRLLDNPHNARLIRRIIANERPAAVFMPHGNDTNSDHRIACELVVHALEHLEHETLLCLNRDPKTIAMEINAVMPFGEAEAEWKAELQRIHASQQQRNLNTRGRGLDERIMGVNRRLAEELKLDAAYAEAFECRTVG